MRNQDAETVRPTSWAPCPYCNAEAHRPCFTRSGRTYPMGSYHILRIEAWHRHGPRTPPSRADGAVNPSATTENVLPITNLGAQSDGDVRP